MSVETTSSPQYRRAGWWLWLTLTVIVCSVVGLSIRNGQERSVTGAYQSAVVHWFAGEPLYNMQGHGFLYLPQAALTYAPWAFLPHTASELVWRMCMIAVLAGSLSRMTKLLGGEGRWFFIATAASVVLAWGCARNGQSTLLITGLMIYAAADLSEQRWWRATALLSLAFAFKPLALVMIMLAAVVYPKTSWRLVIGLIIVGLVPFATQRPDYVISQYQACVQNLDVTFKVGETGYWAQFFGMLQVAGVDLPSPLRTGIRLVAAASTLLACWQAARHLSPQRAALYLFSSTACYLMLFNSRTEGNTYTMVGPVYGALLAEAALVRKDRRATAWMIAAVVLTLSNYELGVLFTPRDRAIWISPLVCIGVSSYLVGRLLSEITAASGRTSEKGSDERLTNDISHARAA
ncbi:glycosyltransferase family 87 protein [Schlesneria sp. DSM 10557]|uniref:glycosyltransferase family 87 protein n=1 Tax=Schlesneria sp. DSM 10557 TaxID=3044399 RepID=UPI00359FC74C